MTDQYAEVFARLGSEQVAGRVATIGELGRLLSEQNGGGGRVLPSLRACRSRSAHSAVASA